MTLVCCSQCKKEMYESYGLKDNSDVKENENYKYYCGPCAEKGMSHDEEDLDGI